jgi:pyruvate/2-oxoglutarate dehydrogenase complex dihydrolipoamide acyltransferase (E2) component
MREPIVVPDLGSSDVVVSVWYVKVGEDVRVGDRVVELLVGAATFDVAAAVSGKLIERRARPQDRVQAGQLIGYLEVPG